MPDETEFANCFKEAQLDLGRREKNAGEHRTMLMWKNTLETVWRERPQEEVHKLFDRQPMIMEAIIEAEGSRTPF